MYLMRRLITAVVILPCRMAGPNFQLWVALELLCTKAAIRRAIATLFAHKDLTRIPVFQAVIRITATADRMQLKWNTMREWRCREKTFIRFTKKWPGSWPLPEVTS